MSKAALVGSWSQQWIDDHRSWLAGHGPHLDGWSNRLGPGNRALLQQTLASQDHGHFFAYMSQTQGGDMRVRYRLRFTHLTYHQPPVPFTHEHGHHGEPLTYPVTLVFRIAQIDEMTPSLDVSAFTTFAGTTLSPRAMRGLYVVRDPT